MVSLPVITEAHTGDLTAHCLRAVYLRRTGQTIGTMPSAMYRGNLAGEALCILHQADDFTPLSVNLAVLRAAEIVADKAKLERRPLTNAVLDNRTTTMAEVVRALCEYGARVAPRVRTLIGCELPIRWTIDVDGEPQEFASHLDILYRDAQDFLCFDDWKWRDESPSPHYLSRNLQFACYAYGCKHGAVLTHPELGDDGWTEFGEWAQGFWIHLDYLRPYGKATEARDDDGEVRKFAKGDTRPLKSIVHPCNIDESRESVIVAEMTERVRMMRAGFWPTNPDPVGCRVCECNTHCPSFTEGGEA
jgi:hypothetical protein